MSYGKNEENLVIKGADIYIGTIDGSEVFTGDHIGYYKQGEGGITFSKEFAEALFDTPASLIDKSLVRKTVAANISLFQHDPEWYANIIGGTLIDHPTDPTKYRLYFGPDEPVKSSVAFRFDFETIGGDAFSCYLRKCKFLSDTIEIPIAGTEHAVLPLMIEAFEDKTITDRTKAYGWWDFKKPSS